jgi:hypothetical protein
VHAGKFLFVHKRQCGASPWDCPFVAANFDEVRLLASGESLLDLAGRVEDIMFQISIVESLAFRQEHHVAAYDDVEGRLSFLESLWDAGVLTAVRVPQDFTANRSLAGWLLANETLEYQFERTAEEDSAGAAVTDATAEQQHLAAAPPEEEQVITEIEVSVEGEKGPRKVNSDGTLEIVPDLVIGRKITCREVKGVPVTWTLGGYNSETKSGSKTTFQLRGWPKALHAIWFPKEKPKTVSIVAKDKQGNQLQASLNVFSGSKEIIELNFIKMPVWQKMKEIKKKVEEAFEQLTGRTIEIKLLEGKIAYSANFKESDKERVFFAYDFAGGLDPLLSAEVRLPIGPTFPAPKILEKYYKYIKFECFINGAIALNFHFVKSDLDTQKAELKCEPKIEFGVEGTSHIEAQILSRHIVVIDAKIAALSGFEGSLGGFGDGEGLGLTGELGWSGIKANGHVEAMDGKFVYKKEIVFVDPITFIKGEKFLFVSEKISKEAE